MLILRQTAWPGNLDKAPLALPASFHTPFQAEFAPRRRFTSTTIQAVSWNIDRGTHLAVIQSELERRRADLYLLQEVDWGTNRTGGVNVADELARSLRLNMAYAVEFEELSQEKHSQPAYIGQATLTALPIQRARILRFQTQSGFWKPRPWIPSSLPLLQRRVGGRVALVTELQFRGRPLVVYNLHLESRSMGSLQGRQLNEVLSDLRQYSPQTAVILAGDFNSKYFPAAFLQGLERRGFRSATGERVERTHIIAMALDWIFVRGPLTIQDGQVRRDVKGSDHYPVIAELRSDSPGQSP